ncbi:radical SAM protein [Candidatus Woesearchaeota archaeon]|nr:radical SAM protein [Candidatus Woesearchaeota archaeon]
MKILLINLPFKEQIIRRFSCTYYAKEFLFPPLELKYIAENIDQKHQIKIIDCIAEKTTITKLIKTIKITKPDVIITLIGIESFNEDINSVSIIKKNCKATVIAIGYYPTIFPKEILQKTKIDIIIKNEPEKTIQELIKKIEKNTKFENQKGISYKTENKIIDNEMQKRIKNLNQIRYPRTTSKKYKDIFSNKRFTTVLAGRGCPFNCDFCIQTYGTKYYRRSNNNIIEELKHLTESEKVKNIRFMDDTFNINSEETIKLCRLIRTNKLKLKWSCLCRVDLLDEKIISEMKKAGCYRIYIGIESLQKENQKYSNNKSQNCREIIKILKKYNIEVIAWFLVGFPNDTIKSIKKDAKDATKLNIDFAIVSQLTPYPKTKFFIENKDKIEFSLFPYSIKYTKINLEKIFYKTYYFNFLTIIRTLKFLIKYPIQTIKITFQFIKYFFSKKNKLKKDFI